MMTRMCVGCPFYIPPGDEEWGWGCAAEAGDPCRIVDILENGVFDDKEEEVDEQRNTAPE